MVWMVNVLSIIILGFALLVSVDADATENPLHPTLAADGWEEINFDGKRPNLYAVCGFGCIQIKSNSSVSMIGKPFAVDLGHHPVLNWEWKIGSTVTPSNLSVIAEPLLWIIHNG